MSLPIDSVRRLADNDDLGVVVTLNLNGQLENRTYPGSYATWSAVRNAPGAELLVFSYADGKRARPRARWFAPAVLGVEHIGDHMAMVQKPFVEPPKPAAGPDYPQVIFQPGAGMQQPAVVTVTDENGTTAGFIVVGDQDTPVAPNVRKQIEEWDGKTKKYGAPIEETQSFDPIEEEEPLGSSTKVSVSPVNDPEVPSLAQSKTAEQKIEESEFWEPTPEEAEMVEEDGWKPRGRPSQHKPTPPRRSPRGKATRAVRGMGTALLLGFALLGYSPKI